MLNKSLHFMLPNGVRIGYLAWFSVLIKCFTPLKDEIFDKYKGMQILSILR